MSDYLGNLAQRAVSQEAAVQPRPVSLFSSYSSNGYLGAMPAGDWSSWFEEETLQEVEDEVATEPKAAGANNTTLINNFHETLMASANPSPAHNESSPLGPDDAASEQPPIIKNFTPPTAPQNIVIGATDAPLFSPKIIEPRESLPSVSTFVSPSQEPLPASFAHEKITVTEKMRHSLFEAESAPEQNLLGASHENLAASFTATAINTNPNHTPRVVSETLKQEQPELRRIKSHRKTVAQSREETVAPPHATPSMLPATLESIVASEKNENATQEPKVSHNPHAQNAPPATMIQTHVFATALLQPYLEAVQAQLPSEPVVRETSTIRVNIGRIEVRAVTPPGPAPRPKRAAAAPRLSLDEYLKQRNGGPR